MDELGFEYTLTGTGWSEATIRSGGDVANLSASYLDDALSDLVRGVLAIRRGAPEVRVSEAEEPGEYRWTLTRDATNVRLVIRWFDELWGSAPDEDGTVVFAATCSMQSLCTTIAAVARQVLETHGTDGYLERWV